MTVGQIFGPLRCWFQFAVCHGFCFRLRIDPLGETEAVCFRMIGLACEWVARQPQRRARVMLHIGLGQSSGTGHSVFYVTERGSQQNGTIRRECLDRTFFWTTADLEAELLDFQHFYNGTRAKLGGQPPEPIVDRPASRVDFASCGWHGRGLYQAPIAT